MFSSSLPLHPKNPTGPLKVLVIGRISTIHQNVENIEASYRYVEDFLRRIHDGPIELRHLGEQASGMLAERATVREAEDLIATGEWDLVIAEDLSRIFRNPRHQFRFVQDAVDADTRVICIADSLDSADENWEVMMGAAALRHGTAIPDTRRRVRRTATHAFHGGGMVLKVKFGYRKLSIAEARTGEFGPPGLRLARRPECTPVIREMKDRVLRGEHYEAVAEWLRREGIERPPYAARWTARLVKNLLEDPLLSGTRTFRRVIHRPIFRTGKHRRVRNAEPEQKHWPELAHFTPDEHAELLAGITRRADETRRRAPSTSPGLHRPRSRAVWPGQHVRCAICGGLMHSFGAYLKCRNARERGAGGCWNHVQVPCEQLRARFVSWLLAEFGAVSGFREALGDSACAAWHQAQSGGPDRSVLREIADLERQAAHLTEAIARGGRLEPLVSRLTAVTESLAAAHDRAERETAPPVATSPSREEVDRNLESALRAIARTRFEWADLLRRAVPQFLIQPVQALDTPLIRPRARFTLAFGLGDGCRNPGVESYSMDLFDPPLHVRVLPQCRQWKREEPGLTCAKLGERLGVSAMTVKRAFDYGRRMERAGLDAPYRELLERPARASRWSAPD